MISTTLKSTLTHLSLWTAAVLIRFDPPSPATKAIPHTLVAFTTDGMRVFRYKNKDAALFFQSFLRLLKIESKVFPIDVMH